METSTANEPIIKVEKEEFTPNEHLSLKFNIAPKASEVFSHTSPTVVSKYSVLHILARANWSQFFYQNKHVSFST